MDADPPHSTVDARQPYESDDTLPRQGIGSPDDGGGDVSIEPITVDLGQGNKGLQRCLSLCETLEDPVLGPNSIAQITDNCDGTYTIFLDHALPVGVSGTAGVPSITTISYLGDGSYVQYTAHPGDANGDGGSTSADVLQLIDDLNDEVEPVHGIYSEDIDHSGLFSSADVLVAIDLLNGAGEFADWNGVSLNDPGTCPALSCTESAGGSSGGSGGRRGVGHNGNMTSGDSEDENACFADGFLDYLSTTVTPTDFPQTEFDAIAHALTDWCVEHFTDPERTDLAGRLEDPELTFADDHAAGLVPQIVEELTR